MSMLTKACVEKKPISREPPSQPGVFQHWNWGPGPGVPTCHCTYTGFKKRPFKNISAVVCKFWVRRPMENFSRLFIPCMDSFFDLPFRFLFWPKPSRHQTRGPAVYRDGWHKRVYQAGWGGKLRICERRGSEGVRPWLKLRKAWTWAREVAARVSTVSIAVSGPHLFNHSSGLFIFRVYSGYIQGTFRVHSGYIQGILII